MIPSFEARHSAGLRACPCLGGGSSSSANQTSTTNNTDARVVGGNDSTNLSANNSTVSVIATDHGAVQAGMQLGTQAIDAVTTASAANNTATADMFKGALATVQASNNLVAQAYQQGGAGDQTTLKYAGFIVVGLAAVAMFRKH